MTSTARIVRGSVWFLIAAGFLSAVQADQKMPVTLSVCDDVQDPATLNPFHIFSEKSITILQQICEGLARFDPQGKVESALAERWERVNDTAVRFYLREDVFFHNGRRLTAQDVKYSLEKYVNPATQYPGFGFMNTILRVDIVNDQTIDVVTSVPDGLILNRLAAFGFIVPYKSDEETGDQSLATRPIGTGPFQFESWERDRQITLKANPNYWMKSCPKVEKLVLKFIPVDQQIQALIDGKVDILTELPGTMTTTVAGTKNLKVSKIPSLYAVLGSLNPHRGPLLSKEVRQALNLAVNREEVIRFDVLGNGRPIATSTMDGEEGHDPDLRPYAFDPDKARSLLKAAGYPNGFKLKVLCKHQGERTFKIISKMFEDVGITTEVQYFSDSEIMDVMTKTDWDILFAGCPDPMVHSFFIQSIFLYSKSPYSLAHNPDYDRMLEKMVTTTDPAERENIGRRIDRKLYDDYLLLPCYQRIKTYGSRKNVKFQHYISGMPYFYSAEKNGGPADR